MDAEGGVEGRGLALALAERGTRGRLVGGGIAGAEEQSLSSKEEGMRGTWEGSGNDGSSSLVEAPSCDGAAIGRRFPRKWWDARGCGWV